MFERVQPLSPVGDGERRDIMKIVAIKTKSLAIDKDTP